MSIYAEQLAKAKEHLQKTINALSKCEEDCESDEARRVRKAMRLVLHAKDAIEDEVQA